MKTTSINELYEVYKKHPVISKDSRHIPHGCLYFALKGESFNGNDFALEALEKGAAYAIVDEDIQDNNKLLKVEDVLLALQNLARLHRSQLTIPIIGITGSNGKTTSKELIHAVLSEKYNTHATRGNYNNHIGVPLTILEIDSSHEMAVIEMGANHQKEIEFLCTISDPDYGLITNIGKAHLEGFGGIEGVKKGKSELYKHIKAKQGKIFINGDDPVLLDLGKSIEQIVYGTSNSFYCSGNINQSQPNVEGSWACENTKGDFRAQIYGEYNFYNILAAICIGNYFKVNSTEIKHAIENYQSTNNRSQLIDNGNFKVMLDAYNANPSSMALALKSFKARKQLNQIVILGDMFELGETSKEEHQKIIALARELSFQKMVFVGKNFLESKEDHANLMFFETTEEAREWFKNLKKENYEFLIKGSRGMALERLLKD